MSSRFIGILILLAYDKTTTTTAKEGNDCVIECGCILLEFPKRYIKIFLPWGVLPRTIKVRVNSHKFCNSWLVAKLLQWIPNKFYCSFIIKIARNSSFTQKNILIYSFISYLRCKRAKIAFFSCSMCHVALFALERK